MAGAGNPDDEDGVRRWGRFRIAPRKLITVAFLLVALVAVLALREACASGAGNLIKAYEAPGDAGR